MLLLLNLSEKGFKRLQWVGRGRKEKPVFLCGEGDTDQESRPEGEMAGVFRSHRAFPQNIDVQTEPPAKVQYFDSVNQWIIFDAYKSYERLREENEVAAEKAEAELASKVLRFLSLKMASATRSTTRCSERDTYLRKIIN